MDHISNYLTKYRKIKKEINQNKKLTNNKVRIAVLSSSTVKGLHEVFFVTCYELGIIPEIYVGGYNQYSQEILDENSNLYEFQPDIIFLFLDSRTLYGNHWFDYYQLRKKERRSITQKIVDDIETLTEAVKSRLKCKIILHNLEVPLYSQLGIIENKQNTGFIDSVRFINNSLREIFLKDSSVYVFDYDLFCSQYGKDNIIDYKMYYLGDFKLSMKYFPHLSKAWSAYIRPLVSMTKKCIVLDLDNTLWGGVVGEDGIEGIHLGPNPEGRPFLEFQSYLLALFHRGIILTINSKNNPKEALNAIKDHPHMILKEEHFAAMKINWNDKARNIRELSNELNIGTDSFVFIDDDPLNREMVKQELPEVHVVDMPADPALYLKTLSELTDFNSFNLTEEDKKKGKMYADQRKREEFSTKVTDLNSYLEALNMKVTIEKVNSFNIPRIAQLTQKTNQYNMTTKRYLEEEIEEIASSENHLIISVRVEDKFGDNGITGCAIVRKNRDFWYIDTFLLSCRIIGRKVEELMLIYIINEAVKAGSKKLIGQVVPTPKNVPARDFYRKNGFILTDQDKSELTWTLAIKQKRNFPGIFKITIK